MGIYEVRYTGGAMEEFSSFEAALGSARRNCQLRDEIVEKFHRVVKHDETWSLQNKRGQVAEIEKID